MIQSLWCIQSPHIVNNNVVTDHLGKFKTGQQEKESDAISADKLYELLLQSDHDRVITSDHPVLSDEVLEALLDRGMSPKNGKNPLHSDTNKTSYFKVLQSADISSKDLQGISSISEEGPP